MTHSFSLKYLSFYLYKEFLVGNNTQAIIEEFRIKLYLFSCLVTFWMHVTES